MSGPKGRKVSDYEINGAVRRALVSRNVDVKDVRYRTHNGAVDIGGTLRFTEIKHISEMAKELFILEQIILGIRGVRKVKIEFDDWERSTSGRFVRKMEGEDDEETSRQKKLKELAKD